MPDTTEPTRPADTPQHITIGVDLLPGPLIHAVAERLLQIVVDELLRVGTEVTAVRIEIRGQMVTW